MKNWQQANPILLARLWLAVGILLCATAIAHPQPSGPFAPDPGDTVKKRPVSGKASQPPAFTIPVEQLGFSAPSSFYLGQGASFASLDFFDENHLLFTFRVPGLIHREAGGGNERRIRAVVLSLPTGRVEAEDLWTLHDSRRYLWMLKDGHFLLRDREWLRQGDATLTLKPFLRFPGTLLKLDMDPAQQFLVVSSLESATPAVNSGDLASQASASATAGVDDQQTAEEPSARLRILRRDSGKVILVSRIHSLFHLPINSDGYLESRRGHDTEWLLNLHYFSGGVTTLGHVNSACAPSFDFVSDKEILATVCSEAGALKLLAMSIDGHSLWQATPPATSLWPLLTISLDSSRLVRETLEVTRPINAYSPFYTEDLKGQSVEVFDAATGKVALKASASPMLDVGGNVAISPSGRRVAVLNAGSIQIFDLPAAEGLRSTSDQPQH